MRPLFFCACLLVLSLEPVTNLLGNSAPGFRNRFLVSVIGAVFMTALAAIEAFVTQKRIQNSKLEFMGPEIPPFEAITNQGTNTKRYPNWSKLVPGSHHQCFCGLQLQSSDHERLDLGPRDSKRNGLKRHDTIGAFAGSSSFGLKRGNVKKKTQDAEKPTQKSVRFFGGNTSNHQFFFCVLVRPDQSFDKFS